MNLIEELYEAVIASDLAGISFDFKKGSDIQSWFFHLWRPFPPDEMGLGGRAALRCAVEWHPSMRILCVYDLQKTDDLSGGPDSRSFTNVQEALNFIRVLLELP